MKLLNWRTALITAAFVACVVSVHQAEEQPAKEKGDLWEVTTQMSLEGMPDMVPSQKQKVCAPKEWKEPPGGMDARQKCTNSDFAVAGPKVTWKTRCEGPPEMTGVGEIVRNGADAYAGSIKFATPDGAMTMKLNGRRVGDCELARK